MGLIICALALGGATVAWSRGGGHAVGFVLLVGSLYGWLRANVFDGYSHFAFDAALLGLYAEGIRRLHNRPAFRQIRGWAYALMALPVVVILASPLLETQPLLVQLLGFRSFLLFVPGLLIGACLTEEDWVVFSKWCIAVVLVATAFAVGEVTLGMERFFPRNEVTELIYRSQDVGEGGMFRIPASFSSAHAYAGTMLALLPVLVLAWVRSVRWKLVIVVPIVFASAGVFLSGARTPVIVLVGLTGLAVVSSFRQPRVLVLVGVLVPLVSFVVGTSERFRRYETLQNKEFVEGRVQQSVNLGLLDTAFEFPFGKGLGSAVGTHVPYFIEDEALPQIGLENEYARLALELGLPGLAVWLGFLLSTLAFNPLTLRRFGGLPDLLMWGFGVLSWGSAATGLGLLASVPSTLLLFFQLGAIRRELSDLRRGAPATMEEVIARSGPQFRAGQVLHP